MKAATTRSALAFAAVLVMFNSSSMARLNATPRSASFKNNGSFVEIEGRLPDGCTSFYLHAAKNGVGSGATTFLYHHVYDWCSSQWIAYGGGNVANSALAVHKNGGTLKIALAADLSAGGTNNEITLTFKGDGRYSTTSSGHYRVEYPNFAYQQHGSWTSSSASVSGSLMGFVIDGAAGFFGVGREKSMTFERYN